MNIRIGRPQPGAPVTPQTAPLPQAPETGAAEFAQALQEASASAAEVKLSAHAQQRLHEGHRNLGPAEMQRLQQAVDRAAAKGARNSLVILDDLALVVSVTNRTVITAAGGERLKEGVFTGIDSAVIS